MWETQVLATNHIPQLKWFADRNKNIKNVHRMLSSSNTPHPFSSLKHTLDIAPPPKPCPKHQMYPEPLILHTLSHICCYFNFSGMFKNKFHYVIGNDLDLCNFSIICFELRITCRLINLIFEFKQNLYHHWIDIIFCVVCSKSVVSYTNEANCSKTWYNCLYEIFSENIVLFLNK